MIHLVIVEITTGITMACLKREAVSIILVKIACGNSECHARSSTKCQKEGGDLGSRSNIWTLPRDLHTLLADWSFAASSGGSHFTSTRRTDTLSTLRLTLKIHSPGPPRQEHMTHAAIIKLVSRFLTLRHPHTLGVQITSCSLTNPFTF